MMDHNSFIMNHIESCSIHDIPCLDIDSFREAVIKNISSGLHISALFGQPHHDGKTELWAILANPSAGNLILVKTKVEDSYPALTPDCSQAHWFEREIAEQWGINPENHPWLKPVRFHKNYSSRNDLWKRQDDEIIPGITNYFKVDGEEVHEVAVGPIHTGIIEPGHFRFQCNGEDVFHLEISLGYQHRGIERALVGGPDKRSLHFIENIAGDTAVGHATAYCHAIESLSGCHLPERTEVLRAIALELERMANHTGDLGALANDVAYLPTSSFCGRIRGDILNMTADICGNRFGRGLIKPGGVEFDIDQKTTLELIEKLDRIMGDLTGAVNLLWETPSVLARFEGTGVIKKEDCRSLGLVGLPERACGFPRDIRFDFPTGAYRFDQIPVSTWQTGDVFARAYVRWLELQRSYSFIRYELMNLPGGSVETNIGYLKPSSITVSMTEGWRGEICHVAITDDTGRIAIYKIVDPSFHNWIGLAIALRNQQISDFPLCNKSFNLSYCGHDL